MEFETGRSVVYPWLCDSMGHLATQHYMKVFDDATYHLLAALGFRLHEVARTQRGWADVSHCIEYRREIMAGDLLVARSTVLHVGRSSLRYRTRIGCSAADGDRAILTGIAVHFDLVERRAIPLPTEFRRTAESVREADPCVAVSSN